MAGPAWSCVRCKASDHHLWSYRAVCFPLLASVDFYVTITSVWPESRLWGRRVFFFFLLLWISKTFKQLWQMWNDISTGRVLILTLSKVKLTLMILLCGGGLAVPINPSGERVCVCVCYSRCVNVREWKHTLWGGVSAPQKQTFSRSCASLFALLCVTPLTVATEQRLAHLPVWAKSVCTDSYPALPSVVQHGTAGPGSAAGP